MWRPFWIRYYPPLVVNTFVRCAHFSFPQLICHQIIAPVSYSHKKLFNSTQGLHPLSRNQIQPILRTRFSNCSDNTNDEGGKKFEQDSLKKVTTEARKKIALFHRINEILVADSKLSKISPVLLDHEAKYDSIKASTETTLEKQLVSLMNSWNIDEATELLKSSITNGKNPDRTILFQFLLQVAQLGKVDGLLEMYHTLLKGRNLISHENFYKCLSSALYESGRVTDGMDMLKKYYYDGENLNDVDILFTLLGTMILKHFDHLHHLLEEFVDYLLHADPPVVSAQAMKWKCLVLAEKFDKAEELRMQVTDLTKLLPAQVSFIVQSSGTHSFLEFEQETVLYWLVMQPYLKNGLRAYALHMLVQMKCDVNDWNQAMGYICVAMEHDIPVQQETLTSFLTRFFGEIPNDQLEFWGSLIEHLQTLAMGADSSDTSGHV